MSSAPDLVGRILAGRYRVLRPIGQGGMGVVYEAEQIELRRRVALKVLFETDSKSIARFRAEAIAASALHHENVAKVYELELDRDQGVPFIVMERIDGESLATLLRRERALAPARAARIAGEILAALSTAHDAGIVHRDIKPGNVLLVRGTEQVKVVDFGIAKRLDGGGVKTTTGTMLGTPGYLAPEQVIGGTVDSRTDLWAVGVCLYEMLAGAKPFPAPSPDVYVQILEGAVPPLGVGVPRGLAVVALRALSKDAADRFPDAAAMGTAIARFDEPEIAPTPAARPMPRKAIFGVAALVTIALTGVVAWVMVRFTGAPAAARDGVVTSVLVAASASPSTIDEASVASPSAVAPTTLAVAVDAPAPRRAKSVCIQPGTGQREYLCPRAVLECVCLYSPAPPCAVPWTEDATCTRQEWARPGAKSGEPCTVYLWHDATPTATGTLSCSSCNQSTSVAQHQLAVPGARCQGFDHFGTPQQGAWSELVNP